MSELEKSRALALAFVLALTFAGLFAFQAQGRTLLWPGARDSLERCAASKGALCDAPAHAYAGEPDIVELGSIVVTAPRPQGGSGRPASSQVAFLGSITVTAPRA